MKQVFDQQDYHLTSCTSESILRVYPSNKDPNESNASWIKRTLLSWKGQVPEQSMWADVVSVGLNVFEPERLDQLLHPPAHMAKVTFYRHASQVLSQELGLNQTPTLSRAPSTPSLQVKR